MYFEIDISFWGSKDEALLLITGCSFVIGIIFNLQDISVCYIYFNI